MSGPPPPAVEVAQPATPAPRHSLRWRLPALIATLIGAVLLTFLWVSFRTVQRTLIQAGGDRAQVAVAQIARLLDANRARAELGRIAADPAIVAFLRDRTAPGKAAARQRLARLATATRRLELFDPDGVQVLDVAGEPPADGTGSQQVVPPATSPGPPGLGPLQHAGGLVFSDLVAEVPGTSATAGAGRLGYLVVRSGLTVNPPGIIGRLVGRDARAAVGNRVGGVWTDFDKLVTPPPVDLSHEGVSQYVDADHVTHVGALVDIAGTPWAAWVEFPGDKLVEPARVFLARMASMAVAFLLFSAALAWVAAARITRPVSEMSRAATALAAGDYSQRVAADRRDEIGLLGRAFNHMADEVESAQDRLESRIAERTRELADARREAERANQAKNAFLSGMSHDLRTPLNAILGFAQILELDEPGADRAEPVRQILSGGRFLLELIDEVLDITRIESGQLSLSPEPVAVRDVVQRAIELIRPLAEQRGITLVVERVGPDDVVRADRQRLNQVLLNLLSNALKYNSPNGRVLVSTSRVGSGRYRIAVTDTGAGIPESKQALLFRPFERLGAEESAVEGTGLGLALSRALAEAMGGTIGFDSVVDRGSTFWVELDEASPQQLRDASAARAAAARRAVPEGRGRVLYVEDNLPNVRLMERILRQRPGVRLTHASNADAALAMVASDPPDAILLDLHLPDMSGEDLLHRLWENPASRTIPAVVVTADATPGLSRRLQAAGARAVLTKPLHIADVLHLVDDVLANEADRG